MEGWIKIHRSLMDWCYYHDERMVKALMHCIMSANHAPKKWQDIIIQSGQFITSLDNLSKELNLTYQQTRTVLDKLEKCSEVTRESTSKYTLITLVKWEQFQITEPKVTGKITNEQQTDNKQVTTNKNVNNVKKIIDHLNGQALKSFKHDSKKTIDLINARINEGYTEEDFIKVIDIKCGEWICNKDMVKYLRPETLFSNKFEGYLNQVPVREPEKETDWSKY